MSIEVTPGKPDSAKPYWFRITLEPRTPEELESITRHLLGECPDEECLERFVEERRERKPRRICEACGLVEFDPECPHWDYDSEAGYGSGGE